MRSKVKYVKHTSCPPPDSASLEVICVDGLEDTPDFNDENLESAALFLDDDDPSSFDDDLLLLRDFLMIRMMKNVTAMMIRCQQK